MPSSSHCVDVIFWWDYRGNLQLIALGSQRVDYFMCGVLWRGAVRYAAVWCSVEWSGVASCRVMLLCYGPGLVRFSTWLTAHAGETTNRVSQPGHVARLRIPARGSQYDGLQLFSEMKKCTVASNWVFRQVPGKRTHETFGTSGPKSPSPPPPARSCSSGW